MVFMSTFSILMSRFREATRSSQIGERTATGDLAQVGEFPIPASGAP
jgi:hypothetical protein